MVAAVFADGGGGKGVPSLWGDGRYPGARGRGLERGLGSKCRVVLGFSRAGLGGGAEGEDRERAGLISQLFKSASDDRLLWLRRIGTGVVVGRYRFTTTTKIYKISLHIPDMARLGHGATVCNRSSDDRLQWFRRIGSGVVVLRYRCTTTTLA